MRRKVLVELLIDRRRLRPCIDEFGGIAEDAAVCIGELKPPAVGRWPVMAVMPSLIRAFAIDMNQVRRVLDVGCGDGRLSLWLADEYDVTVDGVDYSRQRITKATMLAGQANLPCRFHCCDLNYFVEECDKKYDLIVLFELLEHVEQPSDVLHKCRGLLADHGIMVGSVPIQMPYVAHLKSLAICTTYALAFGLNGF